MLFDCLSRSLDGRGGGDDWDLLGVCESFDRDLLGWIWLLYCTVCTVLLYSGQRVIVDEAIVSVSFLCSRSGRWNNGWMYYCILLYCTRTPAPGQRSNILCPFHIT